MYGHPEPIVPSSLCRTRVEGPPTTSRNGAALDQVQHHVRVPSSDDLLSGCQAPKPEALANLQDEHVTPCRPGLMALALAP